MANYRDLISNKTFLDVRRRANNIGEVDLFEKVNYRERRLTFHVPSETGVGSYRASIIVDSLDRRSAKELRPSVVNGIIRNSNLLVYCTCPAFKYWGFKFIGTLEQYGINPETRYPDIRNPRLEGKVCKHLYRALQLYSFNIDKIRQNLVDNG